ncbi:MULTISPECIES: response regulator [unclassified Pseudoalteromonas]|jgi:two-component system response regulator BaeR|uniref:response regulator n=1 Tax=unclassified Pseudoalteromonas TaxID=194690 RepID=UPI0015FFA7D9|nr:MULTISPECIES: response regulator [unclassified Pseudoalteromonas]MBB1327240.1 response regulator [Pseudoalteromonas sp. SR45-1]MBB1352018.1 response regulator [Pseudoalteromonas sp. SG45-3]MBB1358979.1 response regulator [Pseudoalteromonas sp. SG45-6]MBB1432032.1 response regulator [Pseudoalteromonas sp. SG43-4]MBB1456954.1 response regulator [Pseudoalteromonas sp. SG43-5]
MASQKILIVEDEENIAEVLIAYAKQQNYETEHFNSGKGVVSFVKQNAVDLILLDLMLPDVDGIELCKQIRAFSSLPIIMLTAKSEEIDRLQGLEIGADDYICKPFSPKEVVARIKAVLRRTSQPKTNIINHNNFQLHKDDYEARLNDKSIGFTAIEFKIFLLFISHVGRVFTREDIINNVYSDTTDISDRNIDTHIKNIRKKINDIQAGLNPIAAVYSVGYKFKE